MPRERIEPSYIVESQIINSLENSQNTISIMFNDQGLSAHLWHSSSSYIYLSNSYQHVKQEIYHSEIMCTSSITTAHTVSWYNFDLSSLANLVLTNASGWEYIRLNSPLCNVSNGTSVSMVQCSLVWSSKSSKSLSLASFSSKAIPCVPAWNCFNYYSYLKKSLEIINK